MKNPNTFHYLGQRGEGAFEDREMLRQNGLKKPYCMGGPGILMSRQLLRLLEANIDNCLQQVQISQTNITIFDDVLFGICVQRETGLGCWEKQNYREEIFANNFLGEDDFLDDSQLKLSVSVSLHPHKTPGMMKRLHERFKMIST